MEGERVILTTDILMATDSGSEPDELIYTVSVPPEHGHLHMVQSPGVPVLSFSQMDVAANRVCYTHDNSRFADRDSFRSVVFIVLCRLNRLNLYSKAKCTDAILLLPVYIQSRKKSSCFDMKTHIKVHYIHLN